MREFRKQRPDVIQLFDADLPTLVKMVEAGRLDMILGIFKVMPGMRREPTTTWSSLEGERMIALSSDHPHQQLIDKQLAQAAVKVQRCHVAGPRGQLCR
jgi:LysR family transcriptional regulator, carnitine catabolism transcriptional activator